jgi:hypothetical protein
MPKIVEKSDDLIALEKDLYMPPSCLRCRHMKICDLVKGVGAVVNERYDPNQNVDGDPSTLASPIIVHELAIICKMYEPVPKIVEEDNGHAKPIRGDMVQE